MRSAEATPAVVTQAQAPAPRKARPAASAGKRDS